MLYAASGRPRPLRAALLASSGCLLLWTAEWCTDWWLGYSTAPSAILPTAVLLAAAAAATAAILERWSGIVVAVAVPLTMGAALTLWRPLHHVATGAASMAGALALGAMVGLLIAATLVGLARWRAARIALALPLLAAPIAALAFIVQRAASGAAGRPGPDVVLIVMDTTRRDQLSVYGYPRPTSPSLEAFAREATVYDDAWSAAPWTPPSHASLFTGLLPAEHGVDGLEPPPFPPGLPTLAGAFRAAGYRTAGFVSNPNLAAHGWDRDFDRYETAWIRGAHSLACLISAWHIRACDPWGNTSRGVSERAFALAREWWEQNAGRSRFLFVNLIDPHRPYRPPDDLFRVFLPGVQPEVAYAIDTDPDSYQLHPGISPHDADIVRGLYDAEIAAMDREMGHFFDWLRSRGELDHTVIALTADHGERLGERGLLGHEAAGAACMDTFLLRVPLIVRFPGGTPPARVARRVETRNLAAHLLALAGIHAAAPFDQDVLSSEDDAVAVAQFEDPRWIVARLAARAPGTDFAPLAGDRAFVADRRFALIARTDGAVQPELLIDLVDDPGWTRDVRAAHPDAVERLAKAAAQLPRFHPPAAAEIDPLTRDELRTLGYVR